MTDDQKTRSLSQKLIFSCLISLILLSLIWGIGEITTRAFYRPPSPYLKTAILDDELGWKPTANFSLSRTIIDSKGNHYTSEYRSTRDGFREFGDLHSDNYKVFFLGDSYTQGVEVSNEDLFYNLIADSLPIEVFAFGQACYGNLQEYLILDKYLDEIQPDLVILQVCENDFIDNSYELEWEALYGLGIRRPYLTPTGEIESFLPVPYWENVVSQSRFLRLIGLNMRILNHELREKRGVKDTTIAEYKISTYKKEYKLYKEAVDITRDIFQLFQTRLQNKADFFIFSSFVFPPQVLDQAEICTELGIPFYDQIGATIMNANRQGENVFVEDRIHWNPSGQQMVADLLLPYIRNCILSSHKAHLLKP